MLKLPAEQRVRYLDYFLNTISDGCALLDKDFKLTYVNKVLLERRGLPREEYISKHMLEVFPASRVHTDTKSIKKCLKQMSQWSQPSRART